MKSIFILFLVFCLTLGIRAQQKSILPHVSHGKIEQLNNFQSLYVPTRHVDVWLPEGYTVSKKYKVVYMHDGQMLFDSTQTWNKKSWKVADVFSPLLSDKKIEDCIIVGIWNNGADRIAEYFPTKIFNQLEDSIQSKLSGKYFQGKQASGDNYLKFVATELKPYIDKHYSTNSDKENTFMIGSSMGGLITLYAISEYPDVFGGVACLSSSTFTFFEPNYGIPLAIFDYLKKNLPSPAGHKIYMDYGTGESDREYMLTQSFIDLIVKGKGYRESNYMSRVYEKAIHDELSWNVRLHIPVEFLLKKGL